MGETFQVEHLPYIDQREIKRGRCPWCVIRLVPVDMKDEKSGDRCPACGDRFIGKITIED